LKCVQWDIFTALKMNSKAIKAKMSATSFIRNCMCVRETEREKERERVWVFASGIFCLPVMSKVMEKTPNTDTQYTNLE